MLRLRFQQEESFASLRRIAVASHKEEPPDREDLVACVELVLRQCEVISGLCGLAGEKTGTRSSEKAK